MRTSVIGHISVRPVAFNGRRPSHPTPFRCCSAECGVVASPPPGWSAPVGGDAPLQTRVPRPPPGPFGTWSSRELFAARTWTIVQTGVHHEQNPPPMTVELPDGPTDLTARWLTGALQAAGHPEPAVDVADVEVAEIGTG